MGGQDAAAGDGRHRGDLGEDAEFVEAPDRAEVEQGRPVATTGQAEPDP
jgi:hypothetical protein